MLDNGKYIWKRLILTSYRLVQLVLLYAYVVLGNVHLNIILEGLCLNFETIYGDWEPSRNIIVVPARQWLHPESIPLNRFLGSLKVSKYSFRLRPS